MRCPKCGFDQVSATACQRCGVIFDRLRAAPQSRHPPSDPPPPQDPPNWSWMWGILAVAVLAVGAWRWPRPAHDAPRPDPPKAAAEQARTGEPLALPVRKSLEPEASAVAAVPTPREVPPVTARCPLANGTRPSGWRQVPSYWLTGASGYEDALRQRQATAAPMVVYFFADWCGYCKQIDRELFSSAEVERYFSRSVFRVRINPEESDADRDLAARFGVDGYPSFFVVPAGSNEPDRCSLFRRGAKSEPVSSEELEREIERRNQGFAQELIRRGGERRQARDLSGSLALLDQAVAAAPMEREGWIQRAIAREEQGDLDGALADYAVAIALRNDGSAHERAVEVLIRATRFDEAVACATDWLEREPRSTKAIAQRSRAHHERGDLVRSRDDAGRACALGDSSACSAAGPG